jgi:hypothetical protein
VTARRTFLGLAAVFAAAGPFVLRRRRSRAEGLARDAQGVLDVLPGFEVIVLDRTGDAMSDGFRVPGAPDGMGCFSLGGGRVALMRNHELHPGSDVSAHPGRPAPAEAFDPKSAGAVTRLVVELDSLRVVSSNLVLCGTNVNCAGGSSPWGWLSCEEDVSDGHGWVFACDPRAETVAPPNRIERFGRFRHEAAAVDPVSGVAYLTEDRDDGCLYRFVPDPSEPSRGKLQALALDDGGGDTGALSVGDPRPIRWVDIDEPAPARDTVRREAAAKGAARVRRGEGLWLTRDRGRLEVFVAATGGGPIEAGQVLLVSPDADSVETVVASTDTGELHMPDNLVLTRSGHLVMAEDGTDPNGLRVLCPSGRIVTLAQNVGPGEISGVCASPDGEILFASLQRRGITVAIRGPLSSLT